MDLGLEKKAKPGDSAKDKKGEGGGQKNGAIDERGDGRGPRSHIGRLREKGG
jgi:hypothetical protein